MSSDSTSSEDSQADDPKYTITSPDVVTKYQEAAKIANATLKFLREKCVDSARIVELCTAGDDLIIAKTSKVFNKGDIKKGIAFPCCISVNNMVGHFSPLENDETVLRAGDLVKIDLGVHVDGFAAMVADTTIVPQASGEPTIETGRKADVIAAVYTAAKAALRVIKPLNKNKDVTDIWAKCADQYDCQMLEGVLSHEMRRFNIDTDKCIISKIDKIKEHEVETFEFETNQVYAVDIVMTTGQGKVRKLDQDPTVFKRAKDKNYQLRMKTARTLFSRINEKCPTFPFTLRSDYFDNKTRLGLTEINKHDLLEIYPVLYEREDQYIAQAKFTVLLRPSGILQITGGPFELAGSNIKSTIEIKDADIISLLASGPVGKKKRRKRKKTKPKSENVTKENLA